MRKLGLVLSLAACWAQNKPPVAPPAPADVAAAPPSATRIARDVRAIVLEPPAGKAASYPLENDCVDIQFTAWKRDGALYSTSGLRNQVVTQCVSTAMPGLAAVLRLMSPGERRRAWFTTSLGKSAHDSDPDEPVAGIPLTVEVKLVAIRRAPPAPPDLLHPPADAQRFPSGVAMAILRRGYGDAHSTPATRIAVHFTSWSESGRLIETTVMSGHPASMTLGTAPAGWRDALARMSPGEKVRLWIPAGLASPDTQASGNRVVDLELL